MNIEQINYQCISYCDIPQHLSQESWISEQSCDCYIVYSLEVEGENEIDDWIRENYPELDKVFMIHIDY
jgi:hypothetical protein